MNINKENLDKRICDIETGATNTQTCREFITTSEDEFGMTHEPIDLYNDIELKEYVEELDYLWTK
jgi:hypothetical protein